MKIICNGKEKEIKDDLTIEGFILDMQLNPDTVVVECNGAIVLREDYQGYTLNEGDTLELIRFVGGG